MQFLHRLSVDPILDEQGNMTGAVHIIRDITDRKKTEEALHRRSCLLTAINRVLLDGLTCETEADLARTCLAAAEELTASKFGLIGEMTPAQRFSTIAISDPGWHACRMPKTDAIVAIENMPIRGIWGKAVQEERSIIFNQPSSDPAWIGIPQGHPEITSFLCVPLKHAGKTIGIIALANKESGYDLADQQDIEALSVSFVEALMRKRAEQRVRQSELKYKELFESAREAIIIMDLNGKITDANKIVEEYGVTRDHLLGKSIFDFIPVNHRARATEDFDQLCHGAPVKGEMEVIAHKGNLTVEYRDNPIVRGGQVVAVQAILMDITERKKAEDALQESEQRFRNIFDNAVVGLYRTTPDGRILMANPALLRMLGYSSFEELADRNLEQYGFAQHSPRSVFKERIEAEGEVFGLESAWIKRDGTTVFIRESAKVIHDPDGNPLYYEGTVEDITERKKAEEETGKSIKLLNDTGEMAKVGGWELDLSTNVVSLTEELYRIHGLEPGYNLKLEESLDFYAPESRPDVEAVVKRAAETGESYDLESLFIPRGTKDKIWVRSLGRAVYSGGKIVKLAGTFQNIDKYTRAQEKLRISEEKFAKAFNASPAAIYILSLKEGRFKDINESGLKIFGYSREEVVGHTSKELNMWFDYHDREAMINKLKEKGSVCDLQVSMRRKSGEVFDALISVDTIDIEGEPCLISTSTDITERKKAEETLRTERQRLHNVLEVMPMMVCLLTPDYHVAFANRAFREKFGESHGKHCYEYCFGKKEPCDFCESYKVLKTGKPHRWEVTSSDGATIIDAYDFPFTDADGSPMILEVDVDITERKKAEEKIEIFSDAITSAFDCIFLTDIKGNITYANESACKTFGYTPEEFLKLNITKLDADPAFAEKVAQELTTKGKWSGEVVNIRKNKVEFTSLLSAFIIKDDKGNPKGTMGILKDITQQNRAEQALHDYQAELKSLALELSLTEERERRRIAAGIHDDIGQKLALAKMELQLLARPPGKSKIPASLDSVCARIDEAIKDAHALTFELSNPALYDLRFEAAIELWLLERIQKKHGIKCTVIAGEQAVPLNENSKVVLFRALRELAVNVVKHAKATALTVTIEKLENSVQITCKDNGLGFTPPEGGALPRDVGGFGLFNIKERLEHLGGGMKLQSAPGRGTLITLSLPAAAGLPLERRNDADADEGRQ